MKNTILVEFISRFETMGIDVTVNLNAFDHNLGRDKKIRGMAGLNVITFSTKFYKNSHVIAKRVIDIYWFYFWFNDLWLSQYSSSSSY